MTHNLLHETATLAKKIAPNVDYWALRIHHEQTQSLRVRQNILQPVTQTLSSGVFLSVLVGNGLGYAATNDTSTKGLVKAFKQAQHMAKLIANNNILNSQQLQPPMTNGVYRTPVEIPWESISLSDKISLLHDSCAKLKIDDKILDWHADLRRLVSNRLIIDSKQCEVEQEFHIIASGLMAVASDKTSTQVRSGGGAGMARQGGLEQLVGLQFPDEAKLTAEEALQLLSAQECPTGSMDLLLMPSQMVLQIHESIGHPLELDRILGDERNYAGTSFVDMKMFGHYRYGSELLNISFDPTLSNELASYRFDDEGFEAKQEFIIKDGILQRPLGSHVSQIRANYAGVANARASSWNRPAIDRMANLNLHPGTHTLQQIVQSVENGVLMKSNRSWSIDDSRNKFQFGCEFGQLIRDGELRHIVRNPNYRGISASFWRNLTAVGNQDTFDVLGTPNCGKGEPNQIIQVGHASPACLFSHVDVFGGN